MKKRILGASHERATELLEAGCPIDYLDVLIPLRRSFRVEQPTGYTASCVYAFGPIDTAYVIALRLATDCPSGTTITGWSFEPPWKDLIDWDYEPEEIIPKKDQDVYRHLFKSRLTGVLNEGRLIRRGYPVEGVLCGMSRQPIGKPSHGSVSAKLIVTDDLGNTVPLCFDLDVKSYLRARRLAGKKTRQPLSIEPIDSSTQSIGLTGNPEVASPLVKDPQEHP